MNRRNVLIGLGGLVAGSGVLIGTGAFDTVEAERAVSVETAGDASAFLGLEPGDTDHVTYEDDVLVINLDGENAAAEGINKDARTQLGYFDESEVYVHDGVNGNWVIDDDDPTEKYAFVITNQGTSSSDITLDGNFGDTGYRAGYQAHVAIGAFDPEKEGEQYGGAQKESAVDSGGGGPTVTVGDVDPGGSVYISILFDTLRPDVKEEHLDGSLTIRADADSDQS